MDDTSEEQHTPGPWYLPQQPWYDNNRSIVFSEPDPNAGKVICGNEHAEFNPEQYEEGEVKANARLIAAAPDLLRELRNAYVHLRRLDRNTDVEILDEWLVQIKEAIAKAEGNGTHPG